ncbi:serine hydrolase-like protein 2 isoform X2 [Ursus maritimus]|uniref:Serine hydrolase-like protein 2 isoform X2 n=1 Tax=Ursus maritimus TaxID=29073 RepID=A0A8M1GF95_URSMA|nr:serine hydrolase-like protein 2 isoform X2 [Ursus maritimus]
MGLLSELKLAVPWGHIAAKAWGPQQATPVLCLHGWLDNANSFDRLIPLLPKDFHYVAMDFGGHGLSSHYSPGFAYYQENFVSEVRRVVAALKWKRFSLMGHSFGGIVGGTFTSIFPEMVDKLILLDTMPFGLDHNTPHPQGVENLLTYRRGAIEHMLQAEASQKPRQVASPEEMLQGFLKRNSHLSEENARLLLQRGTTEVATGLVMNRDRRMTVVFTEAAASAWLTWINCAGTQGRPVGGWGQPERSISFVSRELFVHSIKQLQARVLLVKAIQGYYNVKKEDTNKNVLLFMEDMLRSILKERFQYAKVPGNHYVHLNQPEIVAGIISAFLQSQEPPPHQP